jgi:preprotein translocase subunit SecD
MQRLLSVLCIAGLAVACQSGPVSSVSPSATVTPTTSQSLLLVFATWVPDTNAGTGPEPGYKPSFTGLTSHDIQRASAAIDATGTSWIVNVTFTSRGADLFKQLTRDNVAACPVGDGTSPTSVNCAPRHLGIWLDLTQMDIDHWDDPAYVAEVSQPFDIDCLANMTAATTCPKFVSDPVTLQEIDGGSAQIAAVSTQESAQKLADAINSASHA